MECQANRSLAGELLGYLLLILCGVALMVWFSTLTPGERQTVADRSLSVMTLLLAQPGVFISAKILSNSALAWHKRIFWSVSVFVVLACAIPLGLSNWLQPLFQV